MQLMQNGENVNGADAPRKRVSKGERARTEAALGYAAKAGDDPPLSRLAPHSIEIEEAVLGAVLVDNEVYGRVANILKFDHFFDPLLAKIYEASGQLITSGRRA